MKKVIAKLKSTSPYGQSKHYEVEMKEKESPADYEKRTWRERMHYDKEGQVYIPPMCFKKCLEEAAKYLSIRIPGKSTATYTKHFEAGVLVIDRVYLGLQKDEIEPEKLFLPSDGKPGGGKRVTKYMPCIPEWEAEVTFYILDETITESVFKQHLGESGKFIGLGFFRPRRRGYWGRFEVLGVQWDV